MLELHDKYDLIIIGSGFAGLAAAIEAAEAGAEVMVLEKMKAPGGNSVISDGGIAAPGTDEQVKAGIADSAQLMYEDMIRAGEGLNYPELVKIVTEQAKETYLWSKEYLGVSYLDRVDLFGGHSVPRCHTTASVSGRDIVKKQLARLKDLKVPVLTGIYVKNFITGPDGRLDKVTIHSGYNYQKGATGPEEVLSAARSLIVASGGFGSDIAFRKAQDPRLDQAIASTNKLFATAEIIKECLALGANPVQLSRIQLFPFASPDEKGFGAGPMFGDYVVLPYGLIIDPKTAARFVNELGNRKEVAEALLNIGRPALSLTDQKGVINAGWDITRALKKGVVKTFSSLEHLADYYEINAQKLKQTVSRYNTMLGQRQDDDFQKPLLKEAAPITSPPFYAMRMWPKVHYTMGGIQIDSSARVIDANQKPIPGLFAAGEVTGGIHGACRLGSCAITESLVMGRIAGIKAVSTA